MQVSVEQLILTLLLLTPAILSVTVTVQPAPVEKQRATVSVADFASSDSPTAGIQEAIDALGENGGIVTIPPGEYLRIPLLRKEVASLHPRSQ